MPRKPSLHKWVAPLGDITSLKVILPDRGLLVNGPIIINFLWEAPPFPIALILTPKPHALVPRSWPTLPLELAFDLILRLLTN